jgi:uncharacterized protein
VIGVDDAAFTRRAKRAFVVAVAMSLPDLVEGVELARVTVDGRDATETVGQLLRSSPFLRGARAVLVDGVAVAGFNLLDLATLSERLERPVISVTPKPPEYDRIRAALRKYFPRDFAARWALVRGPRLFGVPVGGRPLWVAAYGCRRTEAAAIVQRSVVNGRWPEPLRLAHLVGHAVGTRARPSVKPNP